MTATHPGCNGTGHTPGCPHLAAEASGVDLLLAPDTTGEAAGFSRAEAVRAWEFENDLMSINRLAERLRLPNGYVARIEADSDDPGTAEGTGIIEKGCYALHQYDTEGNLTGSQTLRSFTDLWQRKKAASDMAAFAIVVARDGEGSPEPRGSYVATNPSDPWSPLPDTVPSPADVEGGVYPPDSAFPDGTTRDGSGVAKAPDGSRYVDNPDSFWHGSAIISTYTRADALADGALRDTYTGHDGEECSLGDLAKEAGIHWPLAMTAQAHADSVHWPTTNKGIQDETGRAWDVLNCARASMASHARAVAKGTKPPTREGDRIPFQVMRVPNTPGATMPKLTTMHVLVGPGDDNKPCLTIAMPHED